jgi:hypothetical protein
MGIFMAAVKSTDRASGSSSARYTRVAIMKERRLLPVLAAVFAIGGAINYGVWLKVALDLGGNALSGDVRDGRYYVANKGRSVEVSPGVWEYSRVHTLSLFATQPLMLISMTYLAWAMKRRARSFDA